MASFDWVTARSACSLQRVFQTLAEIVDSDVKTVNALERRSVRFGLNREVRGKLIVFRERDVAGFKEEMSVVFELLPNAIAARPVNAEGPGKAFFSAAPRLNQDGECLLEIDGQHLKLWQVSREALEELFFGF